MSEPADESATGHSAARAGWPVATAEAEQGPSGPAPVGGWPAAAFEAPVRRPAPHAAPRWGCGLVALLVVAAIAAVAVVASRNVDKLPTSVQTAAVTAPTGYRLATVDGDDALSFVVPGTWIVMPLDAASLMAKQRTTADEDPGLKLLVGSVAGQVRAGAGPRFVAYDPRVDQSDLSHASVRLEAHPSAGKAVATAANEAALRLIAGGLTLEDKEAVTIGGRRAVRMRLWNDPHPSTRTEVLEIQRGATTFELTVSGDVAEARVDTILRSLRIP